MIRVALPKGRMGDKAYSLFEHAGFTSRAIKEDNRKLVFPSDDGKMSFILVKPTDVPVYVERGAADLGIAGKDILEEKSPAVYELVDLGFGKCRMAVAGCADKRPCDFGTLRVATKYPRVAKKFYASRGRQIDVIELHGSIELAPILGMSDVIVDIVETGTTLRENGLAVYEEIFPSSARLIANRSAYNLDPEQIRAITKALEKEL